MCTNLVLRITPGKDKFKEEENLPSVMGSVRIMCYGRHLDQNSHSGSTIY